MITVLHWDLTIQNPKNKSVSIDTKASAYLFNDEYRICFKNKKQVYYFTLPVKEYSEVELQTCAEAFFIAEHNNFEVAKCVRCSKWHVESGQFCERCKKAAVSLSPSYTELDIET